MLPSFLRLSLPPKDSRFRMADWTTNRHDKALNVTINGPVKFAVVGMDLYLVDDVGKVHKLAIATKTLKAASSAK